MSSFSSVTVGPKMTVKTYKARSKIVAQRLCEHEVAFMLAVPWATPKLIDFDDNAIVMETGVSASTLLRRGEWCFTDEVADLHRRLAAHGVHHRDAHVANYVVIGGDDEEERTVLIDWEVALWLPRPWKVEENGRIESGWYSYDLDGPEVSGVPLPPQHRRRGYGRWWTQERREKYGPDGNGARAVDARPAPEDVWKRA